MTYDLKVILKYCGRSSHEVLGLCGWSWLVLGASVGGFGSLSGPLWVVLAALGAPRDAKTAQERPKRVPKSVQQRPKSRPKRPKSDPRAAKTGPRATKSGPRAAKSGSRAPQERPKVAKNYYFLNV